MLLLPLRSSLWILEQREQNQYFLLSIYIPHTRTHTNHTKVPQIT